MRGGFWYRSVWLGVAGAGLVLLGAAGAMVATQAVGQSENATGPPPRLGLAVSSNVISSCWPFEPPNYGGICGDGVAAPCGRSGVPTLMRRPGQKVRLLVGFAASEVTVGYTTANGRERIDLLGITEPISWTVPRSKISGPVTVLARAARGGDASYSFCIRRG